jgi:Tfp pilus assembly protein PilF
MAGVASFLAFLLLFGVLPLVWSQGTISPTARGIAGTIKLKGVGVLTQRIEVTLLSADRRPMQRTFTDSLGNYQFPGLGPGIYYVVAEVPGYERVDEFFEIMPRSIGFVRRMHILEPIAREAGKVQLGTVSAKSVAIRPEAKKMFERGEREANEGRIEDAAKSYERALEVEPQYAEALAGRGTVYLQQNDLPKARESFAKALEIDAKLPQALLGMGATLARMGEFAAAVTHLSEGLTLQPSSYLGYFERCRAHQGLGKLDESEKDCLEAKRIGGQQRPEALLLLGNLYLNTGRNPEALREFESFLKIVPSGEASQQVRDLVKRMKDAGVKAAR